MARIRLAGLDKNLSATRQAKESEKPAPVAEPRRDKTVRIAGARNVFRTSEQARQEGEAARMATEQQKKAAEQAVAAQRQAEIDKRKQDQITSLRKSLGIDDLVNVLRTQSQETARGTQSILQTLREQSEATGQNINTLIEQLQQQASNNYSYNPENNEFEFPAFDYSEENYGGEEFLDEFIEEEYLPEDFEYEDSGENNVEVLGETVDVATLPAEKRKNLVTVAGKTFDLAKRGGVGFNTQDIKYLQKQGLTKSQILKAASQSSKAPTAAAQRALGITVKAKKDGSFAIKRPTSANAQQQKPSAGTFFASAKPTGGGAQKQNAPTLFASPGAAKSTPAGGPGKAQAQKSAANQGGKKAQTAASKVAQASRAAAAAPPAARPAPAPARAAAPAPAPAPAPAANRGGGGGGGGRGGGGGGGGGGKRK